MAGGKLLLGVVGSVFAAVYLFSGSQPPKPAPIQPLFNQPLPAPTLAAVPAPPVYASVPLPPPRPAQSQPKQDAKVATILTAAAIAALIVQASRQAYYASGRPCACPDDTMRNGRACGRNSAYSKPGGAAPLCDPSDVTSAMIEAYRKRVASGDARR